MKEDVKLPALGENIDSGEVAKVRVSEGDAVQVDSVLLELETEKALLEFPSPVAGTIAAIKVSEGDTVKVGQVLFEVDTDSQGDGSESKTEEKETEEEKPEAETQKEKAEEKKTEEKEEEKAVDKEESSKKKKEAARPETPPPEKEEETTGEEDAKRSAPAKKEKEGKEEKPETESIPVPAGPGARKLARELGVDLKNVTGTARGSRITPDDVKAFAKQKVTASSTEAGPAVPQPELPNFSQWGELEKEKLSSLRGKIADNMIRAWNAVPLVTQFDEADITELEALRKQESEFVQKKGGKLTVTVLVLKALVGALKAHPRFNASVDLQEGVVYYKKYYNIGVAVDTPSGLIVPVIKNVDSKSVVELAVELSELSERARNRKVTLEELQGGNISISNLGGIGGTSFTPLVVPPEVAVVGLSRSRMQPVWKDGAFQPRLILPFCVSYDHKVIDGADAARFARTLAEELENYTELLLSS
jgi:pyruvate dehydrogenase E2 component (dihydrolipoamide acetyltransferase)